MILLRFQCVSMDFRVKRTCSGRDQVVKGLGVKLLLGAMREHERSWEVQESCCKALKDGTHRNSSVLGEMTLFRAVFGVFSAETTLRSVVFYAVSGLELRTLRL